jgi:hypothetical protein
MQPMRAAAVQFAQVRHHNVVDSHRKRQLDHATTGAFYMTAEPSSPFRLTATGNLG